MKWLYRTSIHTRLMVMSIGIILVGFSGLTLIAGSQIETAARVDYEQQLQDKVRLIAQNIDAIIGNQDISHFSSSEQNSLLKRFASQIDGGQLKFYLFDQPPPGGRGHEPAADSMLEIEAARHGGTILDERKNSAGEDTFYTAAPLTGKSGMVAILQLAVPARDLVAITIQRWIILGMSFVLLTTCALLAALLLSRSITRPLQQLRASALRLSRGDFSQRVQFPWKDEIAEVAQAFNEMARQVQSMLEEQRAFASNTSHELRTPLTAIRLRTEALRYDSTLDDTTARQYIEEIDDELVYLSNLVQELILLSRFDAGRAEVGHEQIDFVRMASSLVHEFTPQAQVKHIELTLVEPRTSVLITANMSHLTMVFRNLLDNALKYTPDGGSITWTIQVDEHEVVHTIQDTGQGIAAHALPHLFERFYRADKARSRDIPGTGLGLAIVKTIVDLYHGRIEIESAGINQGTTVHVYWPYQPVQEEMSSAG
ncbi:MAG: HAMP domain-containing protein [Chloroflexi bacterium]|nr:HAMP domain-containing protein [Chloroflexota bacterium]